MSKTCARLGVVLGIVGLLSLGCTVESAAPGTATAVGRRTQPLTANNGVTVNSLGGNGLSLNGIPLNGIFLNGIPLNGIPLNGIFLNGIFLNGIPLNGIPLNGIPLNGIPLNGIFLNGIPLNGVQQVDFKKAYQYMAACALPAGTCANVVDFDGVTNLSYCGAQGFAPEWLSGPLAPEHNLVMGGCVTAMAQAAGDTVPALDARFKTVLADLVACALPEGQCITATDIHGP
jgi:hypothetical protein